MDVHTWSHDLAEVTTRLHRQPRLGRMEQNLAQFWIVSKPGLDQTLDMFLNGPNSGFRKNQH